jgi:membrane-associated phospholipid phosphatase
VPRPVLQGESPSISLLRLIYAIDKPFNGFPSLHVSSAVLLWLYLGQFGRRAGRIGLMVAVVTAVSTLLIKQHVLADVAGGALVGVTGALLAHRASQGLLSGRHPSVAQSDLANRPDRS